MRRKNLQVSADTTGRSAGMGLLGSRYDLEKSMETRGIAVGCTENKRQVMKNSVPRTSTTEMNNFPKDKITKTDTGRRRTSEQPYPCGRT